MSTSTREGGEFDLKKIHMCEDLEEAGVHLSPAEEAVVCGALGCRDGEHLIQVTIEDEHDRVLCPIHAADFVEGSDR